MQPKREGDALGVFRNLRSLFRPAPIYVYGGDLGVHISNLDAAALYRTQPNLRAAISFLADNAAQVPLKVHDRAGDNDRPRVTDSPAALLLQHPNDDMTPFEFKRWAYSDLLLYERFLMLVLPNSGTPSGWEMRPIPACWITSYNGASPFAPESIDITAPGNPPVRVTADKFILLHGYDPTDPMRQYSRISALKETLHEQVESNAFRRQMWHRGGRFNAYLTRPKDVQAWTEDGFERFKETWKTSWAGADAADGGGMPILEDGMEIRTVQFNSRDAQWADSVKLAREDVAGIYHFNPALLWPGSGQTYASARDNARALYNDCLAPTLMQLTDCINMRLLPMIGEEPSHYVVYDTTIKTQGTLEERISAMQTACGGPFMSRQEVRAMMDLPAEPDGELIVPLNVIVGGLASAHDTDPTQERYNAAPTHHLDEHGDLYALKSAPQRKTRGQPSDDEAEMMTAAYRAFFERQAKSVIPKITAKADAWWNAERWDRELEDDLYATAMKVSAAAGERAVRDLWGDAKAAASYDAGRTEAYIRSMCRRRAEMVNQVTHDELEAAIDGEWNEDSEAEKSTPEGVFENAVDNRSESAGKAFACALVSWAVIEACRQNDGGERVTKTWVVTSGNPRASHAAMNGETVPYGEAFSNGAQWPGDIDALDVSEVANCQCVVDITIG